ncbi:four-carbon acid sugar kinase family protein [Paenarthrobacter nitroguajacolicus]|uniref:four-carbon acid sugar kinase family protein n=1 Tax=Paenarthrobacter nitroguajacolicus TaxID=211146 RepID=UPI00248C168A|nr:four-carbon acid sugar kinase family protein [Paenarthrobacter nitroguajacolicus]
MILEADVLAAFPAEVRIPAQLVADAVAASTASSPRVLVVLDDDPTGTQSVADLAVLTSWNVEDFAWAFTHIRENQTKPAVYVLTNTRSLDPAEAAARNQEIVRNALAAAAASGDGLRLGFVSRSDSTLRGHYPVEPDTIAETVAAETGEKTDGVVIVPAFPDAGRVTIGGVHYMRADGGKLTPVAETEFAKDASFGFTNSEMAKYVEEKSQGRFPASSVIVLDLDIIRAGASAQDPAISAKAIADAIEPATNSTPIVADIVTENDFRALALGLEEAERRGKKLLYRVGPPFVRGRIGQEIRAALTAEEAFAGNTPSTAGGLIVVGSHVGVTTRQLNDLTSQHSSARIIEIDVEKLLAGEAEADAYIGTIVSDVVNALHQGDVIVHTSRLLIKTDDAAASLKIARTVSAAVVAVVNRTLKTFPPRFVIAKGGITSSDVAAHGLEIRHGIVRGPMLPGIVSLWEPVDGPAKGIPYIVFAGNVGDDQSLTQVTRKLSTSF